MNQPSSNPLAKHFRQPALHTKLISGGKYWKPGTIELGMTGEIPVYPMTARDEIVLRTPDALMNGSSVVEVVQSCCPNIKDAWEMPSVDVDNLLISIRIASYGNMMAISAKCPKCGVEHDYDVDLGTAKTRVSMPPYDKPLTVNNNMVIKLRPLTYRQVSRTGSVVYEEERLIQALNNEGLSEEQKRIGYENHIKNMLNISIDNVTNSTESITCDDMVVTDPTFIKEFYQNAESSVIKMVQRRLEEYAKVINLQPEKVACTDCGHTFEVSIEFDYSSFFEKGF
jgi:hypothetical protein